MSEQGQTKQQTGFPESKLPRDPETGYFLDIPARIREIYKHNCFMSDFFHINIDEIHCGSAQVSLHVEHDKHSNHRNVVHGGALTALAGGYRRICWGSGCDCQFLHGFYQQCEL